MSLTFSDMLSIVGSATAAARNAATVILPDEVPPPYAGLLVHRRHMTAILEAWHGSRVRLRVLAEHIDRDIYARRIQLDLTDSARIVEYGIMRIRFAYCCPEARTEIIAAAAPLGRILLHYNELTDVRCHAFVKITPNDDLRAFLRATDTGPMYGRLATIYLQDQPAVDLLEIMPSGLTDKAPGPDVARGAARPA